MRESRRAGARLAIALLTAALATLLAAQAAAAAPGGGTRLPSRYVIPNVPLWQQQQALGCGAASAQMVMDYWGPFIDQREVYNAARTWQGTAVGDLARAGQFSDLSWPAGDNFPSVADWGYTERPLGYAGFFYGQSAPWLDKLKAVIAQGYPVICLTDWLPGVYGPHYRVVVGYDDAKGVVYLNDPWCRDLKSDMDVRGSYAPNESVQGDHYYQYAEWTYSDFLSVWQLPGDDWGLPGYRYCAVLVAPWKVQLSAPAIVNKGAKFTVTATVTYPCVAPFGTGAFPVFPATGTQVSLAPPAGFTALSSPTVSVGGLAAGGTAKATFTVKAASTPGANAYGATAEGLASGSLNVWQKYDAYSYTDRIGGTGSGTITVK